MVMKKNFTKYIIVILFWTISLLLFLSSCITEKQGEGEIYFFVYKNNTSFLIKMESYTKDRLVDSLTITPLSSYETGAWENFFSESDYDYSKIVFDNKKYLIYDNNYGMSDNCQVVSKNPYCLTGKYSSYKIVSEKLERGTWNVNFIYTFTEEDYRNAIPLVFGEGFVGSVWRCTEGAGLQEGLLYSELRFVSEGTVEGWAHLEEEEEPELYFTAFYTLEGETLTISEDGDSFTATLNEDYTGLLTNIDGEGECVFVKQ